jgi:hypothetical protein
MMTNVAHHHAPSAAYPSPDRSLVVYRQTKNVQQLKRHTGTAENMHVRSCRHIEKQQNLYPVDDMQN